MYICCARAMKFMFQSLRQTSQSTFLFDSLWHICVWFLTLPLMTWFIRLKLELSKKPKTLPRQLNWAYLFKHRSTIVLKQLKPMPCYPDTTGKASIPNNTSFVFTNAGTCPLSHARCLCSCCIYSIIASMFTRTINTNTAFIY